jgi:hypothetical protein
LSLLAARPSTPVKFERDPEDKSGARVRIGTDPTPLRVGGETLTLIALARGANGQQAPLTRRREVPTYEKGGAKPAQAGATAPVGGAVGGTSPTGGGLTQPTNQSQEAQKEEMRVYRAENAGRRERASEEANLYWQQRHDRDKAQAVPTRGYDISPALRKLRRFF